jgi:peptidoglycan hydrolase-like protein with peptidoglycan-binding domain
MIMMVNYLSGDVLSEDDLDKEMDIRYYDNPREDGSYGASTASLVKAFKDRGYAVVTSADTADESGYSFHTEVEFGAYLKEQLTAGHPTMVENVEWGGHWMVIIGYDDMGTDTPLDDVLVFADPYDTTDQYQDGYFTKNFEKYYCEWFDAGVMSAAESVQQYITVSVE